MPTTRFPVQPTTFIGREKELSDIALLLADPNCRLLTIVGVGGIGKTRLALEASQHQEPYFEDGIIDVALAPVISSDLLVTTIADRLGLTFRGQDTPQLQLSQYLQDKQILLVLDNFEHLIESSVLLSNLLKTAPDLKILVTSRERLNLQEEWTVILEGLEYPTYRSSEALESFSALQLFVQRARQVHSKFSLQDHANAVVAICQQGEGMPLALELAASWLRVMSCEQVAEQMGRDLDFLTTPVRNVPERHRSLRSIFEQSWRMLTADEQAVLIRLSVFRGGFNLESAESVAGATLTVLASLVDKSLVRVSDNGRYDLHELLRQYAAEKLDEIGIAEDIIHKHISYFLQLAEQAEFHLFGRDQIIWFDRLEIEIDNLRAALARSVESETGLKMAAALGWFFSERSYWSEGLAWLEQSLSANPDAPASLRAKALHSAGGVAGHLADGLRIKAYCEQALAIARPINDNWNVAWSLSHLGLYAQYGLLSIHSDNGSNQAAAQLEESIKLFRQLKDQMGLAHTLLRLYWNAMDPKDLSYAQNLIDEASILVTGAGDTIMSGWISYSRGFIARFQNDWEQARLYFEAGLTSFKRGKFFSGVHASLVDLAITEVSAGNLERAQTLFNEALTLTDFSSHDGLHIYINLGGIAVIAKLRGHSERAVRLFGAATNTDWVVDWLKTTSESTPFLTDVTELRTQMEESAFNEAWAEGKAMTRKEIIAYALEDTASSVEKPLSTLNDDQPLTERETEILRLMSEGLNSTEIAKRLILSVGTIRWYLKEIYSKLDVHSRSEALSRAKSLNLFQ